MARLSSFHMNFSTDQWDLLDWRQFRSRFQERILAVENWRTRAVFGASNKVSV
jgi:hypothetical protein